MFFQFAEAQTSKLVGDISIKSNDVDRGITQSNKSPSVGAGFGYMFGKEGKIALDSASVAFPSEGANVRLGFFGEYKFIFSPTADLKVRNDWVRYFSENKRNKTVITLDQNFSGWHILASREDNFEGTKEARNWFGLHRDIPMGSLILDATVGYSQVASPYQNYFDTKVGITYPSTNLSLSLFHSWVSNSGQFNGQADMAFYLALVVNF